MRREISILAAGILLFGFARAFAAPEAEAPPPKRVLGKYTIYPAEKRAEVRATVCLTYRHPGLLRRQCGQRQGIRVGACPRRPVP